MLLLLITGLFQTFFENCIAQKFRDDYLWSSDFVAFYRVHDYATTWHKGWQICEAEGTSLLVPTGLKEMDNLKIMLSNIKPQHSGIFIGIHAQFSREDFVTLKGVPIADTILNDMWGDGQPDLDNDSLCVLMDREGLFDDRPCDEIHPFICKIFASDIHQNEQCGNFDKAYKPSREYNKCYKLHKEPLTWHDAYLTCQRELGQLVILNSEDEASYIVRYFERIQKRIPGPEIFYAGFSDLMYPYRYRTITGQKLSAAGYSFWDIAEKGKLSDPQKRCGAITRTGTLVTAYCDRPAMFICQITMKTKPNEYSEEYHLVDSSVNNNNDDQIK